MDDESARLVYQLHLEDLQHLQRSSKGKQRQGEMSDFEHALSVFKNDLEASLAQNRDRQMCISIARAVASDAPVIQACSNEELLAAQDRAIAMPFSARGSRSSKRHLPGVGPAAKDESKLLDDRLFQKFERLNLLAAESEADICGESSTWAATRGPGRRRDGRKIRTEACIICGDEHVSSSLAKAPCSHKYCVECINILFQRATVDESLFPPRCCSIPIPVDDYLEYLSTKVVGKFMDKQTELTTKDRTYCHRPKCSRFIPPRFIKDGLGLCMKCHAQTCVTCKGAKHAQDSCPQDNALQEVLQIAQENGWQQCRSCNRLVELSTGCYHMTCLCRAEFCYHCGERWKTCDCPQWEEQHIMDRAENIVDRDADNMELGVGMRAELVRRAAADLQENHECRHTGWKSRGGIHRCEECHDFLTEFIYECRQCHLLACRRCRFNRL